jgi:hypothetical protein
MGPLAHGHCRRMPAREEMCDYIGEQEAAALQRTDCPLNEQVSVALLDTVSPAIVVAISANS